MTLDRRKGSERWRKGDGELGEGRNNYSGDGKKAVDDRKGMGEDEGKKGWMEEWRGLVCERVQGGKSREDV